MTRALADAITLAAILFGLPWLAAMVAAVFNL